MIQTRHGSCHCGAVRLRHRPRARGPALAAAPPGRVVRLDPALQLLVLPQDPHWKSHVPAEAFRLLQGADHLSHYRFGEVAIDHAFCRTCGVYPFVGASEPAMGGDFYCVNVACLDEVSEDELAAAPIRYEDGARDDWGHAPRVMGYL